MLLVDLLLYGAVGWGAAVAVRRAFPDFSLSSFIPSKTLKGSPEDIDPALIAANLYLTKIIKDIREEGSRYVTSNSSDCFEYQKGRDKIRLYSSGCFNRDSKITYGSLRFTLCVNNNHLSAEFNRDSKASKDLHKTVCQIKDLIAEVSRQKARAVANESAFKIIESLTPKPTPEPTEIPPTRINEEVLTSLPQRKQA